VGMSGEIDYRSEITNICIKINTIMIQAKGNIIIQMKKEDLIGIDIQEGNVRFIFKNIRYRLEVAHGDKRVTNQVSELMKILENNTENKVELYKQLENRLDEVDTRSDNAESEIAELRELIKILEKTVKKNDEVQVDLLGINT